MVATAVNATGGVVGILSILVLQLQRATRHVDLAPDDRLEETPLDRLDLLLETSHLLSVGSISF